MFCFRSISTNDGPWQSYCDCFSGNPSLPREQNILPVFDGIYYEPAEIYPVKKIRFTDPPFYLLTPGVRFNLEDDSLADAGKLVRRRFDIPSSGDDRNIKNSKTYLDTMNVDNNKKLAKSKEHPLYIDVTSEVSINESGLDQKEVDRFRNAQLMEKKLLECLDLHLLACFRQNDQINDLKEAWDLNKFEKYGNITDKDLKTKIIEKCSEPAKVLKESLKQIKGKNLRESSSFEDLREEITNDKENRTLLYKTLQFHETTTENSKIMHSFFPQGNKSDVINNRLNSKGIFFLKSNKTVSSKERTILNKDVNFDNNHKTMQSLEEETFNKIMYSQSTVATYVNSGTKPEFTFEDNTYNNSHLKSTDFIQDPMPVIEHKLIRDDQKIKAKSYADIVLATETTLIADFFENSIHPNDGSTMENNKARHKNEDLELKDEIYSAYNFVEGSTNKAQNFEISTEEHKIESKTKFMLPTGNDNIIINYDGAATTKMVSHSEDRNIITDDQLQIPKIITIEFPNNTAISSINGIEQIPNNDFVNDENHMIGSDEDNMSRQNIFNDSTSGFPEAENITITTSKITGKLVFIFDKQNIPAHFVQSTDGNIQVGIDGPALCEKLEFLGNKSVLLTVLCNCFRYNNCTKQLE